MMRRLFFGVVMTLLAACPGAPASNTDAGLPDAGLPDAGLPDAGLTDAGLPDAGLPDAGVPDAGVPDAGLPDAGLPDAGLPDAGVDAGACTDPFEPNDTAAQATNAPGGLSGGLSICSADLDWFRATVAPGRVVTVGIVAALPAGDLDLVTFDSSNQCVGGRSPGTCVSPTRFDETGEEFQTVVNARDAGSKTWLFQVNGYQAATNGYVLSVDELAWSDGRDCGAPYTPAECTGQFDAGGRMLQVPYAALDDAYVGDGYRLDSPANYRFARRELVMLLRYAIHRTQQKFPNTLALGVKDLAQRDGESPGLDVGDPRHPAGAHVQGGSVDVAWFTTLAGSAAVPYNQVRIICDANQGSNDGTQCTSAATTLHVVDLPRQVFFLASLFESARLRVIGVDQVIAPLLQQEADRQLSLGWISQAERDAFFGPKLASGAGWPFHHHNIHVSLAWW